MTLGGGDAPRASVVVVDRGSASLEAFEALLASSSALRQENGRRRHDHLRALALTAFFSSLAARVMTEPAFACTRITIMKADAPRPRAHSRSSWRSVAFFVSPAPRPHRSSQGPRTPRRSTSAARAASSAPVPSPEPAKEEVEPKASRWPSSCSSRSSRSSISVGHLQRRILLVFHCEKEPWQARPRIPPNGQVHVARAGEVE